MNSEPDENSPLWILAYAGIVVGSIVGGARLLGSFFDRLAQGSTLALHDYIAPMLITGGIASVSVALVYLLHWMSRSRLGGAR